MRELKRFATQRLRLTPEQVQVFTPTPSTWSTAMYYTGIDPFAGGGRSTAAPLQEGAIHVTRGLREKQNQKDMQKGKTKTSKNFPPPC
jgi:radical SAM superfamily enzyme YgiQ (UPF0313 family)